ncbi:MAG: hypothetical protein ACI4CT_01940 [Lachnospiraceae bacterium]
MKFQTKIIVLKAKELLYTGLFLALGIILILLLIFMFRPHHKKDTEPTMKYIAGVYQQTLELGENECVVTVTVDSDQIKSVKMKNLNEAVTTMYPLMKPAIEEINAQLPNISSIDELEFENNNQYTNQLLKQTIKKALEPAIP